MIVGYDSVGVTFLHHIYSAGGENKRRLAVKSFHLLRINPADLAHEGGPGVEIDLIACI